MFGDLKPGAIPYLGLIFVQLPLSVVAALLGTIGARLTRRPIPFAIAASATIIATLINAALAAKAGLL